jgi:23S rRNA pseudouridine2605 synthase
LQKIIAAAGVTSRRHAEELITQGRVTVNGQTITELGSKADLETDHIKVDGKLLQGVQRHVYLLLNKPKGYVTTVSDPEGRPTVMELVKQAGARIYPVGRLDYLSEGLLLMTNDGALANHLMSAASHVPKTYLVKVSGQPKEGDVEKLRHGIKLSAKPGYRAMHAERTAPAEVRLTREGNNPWYEVTLIEGKNRQIRRMFEEIGHHVEKIKRVRYGALTLDVEPGQFRELTAREVAMLRRPGDKQVTKEPEGKERRPAQSVLPKPKREFRKSGPRAGGFRSGGPRPSGTRPSEARARGVRPAFTPQEGAAPRREFAPRKNFVPRDHARPAAGADAGEAGTRPPSFPPRPSAGGRPSFGSKPGFRAKPNFGAKPGFGSKPSFRDKPAFGDKPRFGAKPSFRPKPGFGSRPAPRPDDTREDADRESSRPRRSFTPRAGFTPREDSGPRKTFSRRPGGGPRQESGDRPGSRPRPSSGPRSSSGPREGSGPRKTFGPRKSGGPHRDGKPGGRPPRRPR